MIWEKDLLHTQAVFAPAQEIEGPFRKPNKPEQVIDFMSNGCQPWERLPDTPETNSPDGPLQFSFSGEPVSRSSQG